MYPRNIANSKQKLPNFPTQGIRQNHDFDLHVSNYRSMPIAIRLTVWSGVYSVPTLLAKKIPLYIFMTKPQPTNQQKKTQNPKRGKTLRSSLPELVDYRQQ